LSTAASYDYVVVGAGSAGCALARRLSDRPEVSVCLLEAGGPDVQPAIHDPEVYFSLWGTEIDWDYRTVPQRHTANRVHLWPRGKVLGGTSSLNGMVYLRGGAADYDFWAYQGNVGWDWESVRRSFGQMEELLKPAVLAEHNELSYAFIDACVEVGHPRNERFNTGLLDGVGWNESTIYERRRQSAAAAFVTPVLGRPNLTVMTGAHALRLAVEQGRVSGVEYVTGGGSDRVSAAEEVVLSAGAVGSPRLLLSSGIGPAGELEELGIDVVHDLPGVGRNLVDHMLIGVVYGARAPVPPLLAAITECCAFARSDPRRVSPDIEISFAKQTLFAEGHDVPEHCYTIIPGIVRPQSRGFVRLRSDSPLDPPLINPHHLAERADVQGLIDGITLARQIGGAGAFEEWRDREVVPGPDADLEQYVRRVAGTWFHPVGTCRMGRGADAVVDEELRVRGLEGLRIADASIMPEIVSVNTNGAAMMIGWHGAGIILG
jgi:choline dehydrogenase